MSGTIIDSENLTRVKMINYNGSRDIRVYFDRFDGSVPFYVECPDPEGSLYETFQKRGILAS
jgi:hypothetical protein